MSAEELKPVVSVRTTKEEIWKNTVRVVFGIVLMGIGSAVTFAWNTATQYPIVGFVALGVVAAAASFFLGMLIERSQAKREDSIKQKMQHIKTTIDQIDFARKYEALIEAIKNTEELGTLLRSDYVHISKSNEKSEYRETMLNWWDSSLSQDIKRIGEASESELIDATQALFSFCKSIRRFAQDNASIIENSFQTKFNRMVINGVQRIALSSKYKLENGRNPFNWHELEEINIARFSS